jgi:hypothetical protein
VIRYKIRILITKRHSWLRAFLLWHVVEFHILYMYWQVLTVTIKWHICYPTPRNESLCAFGKSEKKGKVNKIFSILHYVFVKIDQLRYPANIKTTAHQTCYDIMLPWSNCFSFKGSQWAGVIMCLPSKLCQISIDSDQVRWQIKAW